MKSDEYVSAVVVTRLPEAWRERREAAAVDRPPFFASAFFCGRKPLEDCELVCRRPLRPGELVVSEAAMVAVFVLRRMLGACTGTFTLRLSCLSMSQMSPLSKAVIDAGVACFCAADTCTIELCRFLKAPAPILFEVFVTTLFDARPGVNLEGPSFTVI